MQLEGLGEVGAHGVEGGGEVFGGLVAQLCPREIELVRGETHPLVCGDDRQLGPSSQIRVGRVLLFALPLTQKPAMARS